VLKPGLEGEAHRSHGRSPCSPFGFRSAPRPGACAEGSLARPRRCWLQSPCQAFRTYALKPAGVCVRPRRRCRSTGRVLASKRMGDGCADSTSGGQHGGAAETGQHPALCRRKPPPPRCWMRGVARRKRLIFGLLLANDAGLNGPAHSGCGFFLGGFLYRRGPEGRVCAEILDGFNGTIQVRCLWWLYHLAQQKRTGGKPLRLFCWAHGRRK